MRSQFVSLAPSARERRQDVNDGPEVPQKALVPARMSFRVPGRDVNQIELGVRAKFNRISATLF